jgi:hypothetical protein
MDMWKCDLIFTLMVSAIFTSFLAVFFIKIIFSFRMTDVKYEKCFDKLEVLWESDAILINIKFTKNPGYLHGLNDTPRGALFATRQSSFDVTNDLCAIECGYWIATAKRFAASR